MTEEPTDFSDVEPFTAAKRPHETNGDFVRFEYTLYPSDNSSEAGENLSHQPWVIDCLSGEHVHPDQEEYFKVLSGEWHVVLESGEERTLTESEEITIEKNVSHRHWNPTNEPTRLRQEWRPAKRSDEFIETAYALAQAGRTDENGIPNVLQYAVTQDAYPNTVYTTAIPVTLQKIGFKLLAPIGRLAGYEPKLSLAELDVRG